VLFASSDVLVSSAMLERWVLIEDLNGDRLKVRTFDDEVWAQLVQLYYNGSERWIGGIVETYENEWGFRFDPDTIQIWEYTAEGAQSSIILISEDLAYWLGNIAYVCATVVEVRRSPDVNGDGIVDIFDIGYISSHWYPGPPVGPFGYDANADINNDDAVDIFDIGIASAHWGES
jgi:hypothetical protein